MEAGYRCVYCLSHEREIGPLSPFGGFEIEHFKPESIFPHIRCSYANLFWACQLCNRAKGDSWPSTDELALGYRFLDPLTDAWSTHVLLEGDVLEGLTEAGEYTKDEVDLNSPIHRKRRGERAEIARRANVLEAVLSQLEPRASSNGSQADLLELAAIREELAKLRERSTPPDDQPTSCFCSGSRPKKPRRYKTRRERIAQRAKAIAS